MKFKIFLDEAWRWPLAWPVVVWWVAMIKNFETNIFDDSKKLSEKKREIIFDKIKELENDKKLIYSFWYATAKEIDNFWISQAINLATKRLILAIFNKYISLFFEDIISSNGIYLWDKLLNIEKLKKITKIKKEDDFYNLDYKEIIKIFNEVEKIHWIIFDWNTDFKLSKDLWIKIVTVIKWDSKVPLIWAASIIAKVTRDNWIKQISQKYPDYNFEQHKWYWTAKHREQIKKLWPCEIHRISFLWNILK